MPFSFLNPSWLWLAVLLMFGEVETSIVTVDLSISTLDVSAFAIVQSYMFLLFNV